MGAVLSFTTTLESVGPCSECGVESAMPANMLRQRRSDKQVFYCPNGHQQMFRKSDVDDLKEKLEREQVARKRAEDLRNASLQELENARLQTRMTRGKLKALKQRTKNGVCPCCHRSFVQLQRHMATKHPEFANEESGE